MEAFYYIFQFIAANFAFSMAIGIDALVNKKINEYSTINRFIVEYQIDFSKDELMLNVASIIPSAEVDELVAMQ